MERTLGLYLHIPFCVRKCNYCDFCSARADVATRAAYVDALCTHLADSAAQAVGRTVDTVYIGGGTPTLLDGAQFSRILDTVRRHYALDAHAEITAECNPATGNAALLGAMRESGVNRLSIGLQSIHKGELSLLGRVHTADEFYDTYRAARAAGFDNVSADVMYGIPAQSVRSFRDTLTALCDLAPEHISAYGLRVEEGTPFHAMRNTLPFPTEDEEADMADLVATLLPSRGYARYEISNYARNGYESRHNLRYWLSSEYLGFGPAAHSFFDGVRYAYPADTARYVAAARSGTADALREQRHVLTPHEQREEYVMLRMRLAAGLDLADFEHRFGTSFADAYGDISHLVRAGLLCEENGRLAFSARGMQLSNAILSEWLDFGGSV